MESYTTTEKINSIVDAKEKEAEAKKVVISNDAYALREILEKLNRNILRWSGR